MASVRFRPDPAKSGGYMIEAVDNEEITVASVGPVPPHTSLQRAYDEPGNTIRLDDAVDQDDMGAVSIAGDLSCKPLSIERLYALLRDELTRFGGQVQLIEHEDDEYLRVILYTEFNSYGIRAKRRPDGTTYLGCEASHRRSRPGEKQLRGRDLSDGKLSYDTLHRIFRDIVAYELTPLGSGIVTL